MMNYSSKQILTKAPAEVRRGRTRLLQSGDIPRLADMFQTVFRRRRATSNALLESHLTRIFIEHPHYDDDTGSLVYERPDGDIAGMLGVLPLHMRFDDRPLKGSIISTWMIENPARDSHAAVALARAHLKRKHAMTMSDTANETSIEIQTFLRFKFASSHSLQWVKALNFSAYATSAIAGGMGMSAPQSVLAAAHASERLARRALGKRGVQSFDGWQLLEVPPEVFAYGFLSLVGNYRLRPDWSIADVVWMLKLAATRKSSGVLHLCEARDAAGELAGVCAYFAKSNGRAEVLQIVARPRADEGVLRALISDARRRECAYVCGPASPALIRGLIRVPKVFYRQTCGTVLKSESSDLFNVVAAGEGLIGGLIGDSWTPLATEAYA